MVKRVIVNPADVYDYHDEDKKYADYRFTKRDQIRINSMIDKKQEEAKKRKEAKKKRKQKRK